MTSAALVVNPPPTDGFPATAGLHEFSLMCDDIHATIAELRRQGIAVDGEPEDHGYGITVMLTLPGDLQVQLYEPRHPTTM